MFSRTTNLDAALIALAAATRPLRVSEIRNAVGLPLSQDERKFVRLAERGILRRTDDSRRPGYELDRENPIYPELKALLQRLAGQRPKKNSQPRALANVSRYRTGIEGLFGGRKATKILVRLAHGPLGRTKVTCGDNNLEAPLSMWIAMGVVQQRAISSRRRVCSLNQSFVAHAEMSDLLIRMSAILDAA